MSILDLSKQHMYICFYDVMKPKEGNDIRYILTLTGLYFTLEVMIDIYIYIKI